MAKSENPSQLRLPFDGSGLVPLLTVFYSYAHADEWLRNELDKQLSPLRRSCQIATWHDREIMPATVFGEKIDKHLKTSDIVLLLVSPDFLASQYCYCKEMQLALERHEAGLVRVIPIILKPCDWLSTPLGNLLALPKDGKPVSKWRQRAEALFDVAKGVRRVVEDISKLHLSRIQVRAPLTAKGVRRKA